MSPKPLGYLLFFAGIISIMLTAVSIYLVFSGAMQPVSLFKFPAYNLDSKTLLLLGYKNAPPDVSIELIPATTVNLFANLFAHITLMGFIGGVGYKISLLGAQLIRPIDVYLQAKSSPPASG